MEVPPSLIIDLDPPIVWNNKSVAAIELREPKAMEVVKAQGELKNAADSTVRWGIALIAAVSGEPRQIVEQMPISKVMIGIDYMANFLQSGPATGEN